MRHRYIGLHGMVDWCAAGVGVVGHAMPCAMFAYGAINVALGNRPSSAEQRAALLMLT